MSRDDDRDEGSPEKREKLETGPKAKEEKPPESSEAEKPARRGLRRSRPISVIPEASDVEQSTEKRRRFFTRAVSGDSGVQSASGVRRRWRWFRPSSRGETRPPSDLTDTEARAEAARSAAAELRDRLKQGAKPKPATRSGRIAASVPPSGTSAFARPGTSPVPGRDAVPEPAHPPTSRAGRETGATRASSSTAGLDPAAGAAPGSAPASPLDTSPEPVRAEPAAGPRLDADPGAPGTAAEPGSGPTDPVPARTPESIWDSAPGSTVPGRSPFEPAGSAPPDAGPDAASARPASEPAPRPATSPIRRSAARPTTAPDPGPEPAHPRPQRSSGLRLWRRPLTELSRPAPWQRHDLLVVAVALALFVIGVVSQHRLAAPALFPMNQLGLHLSCPSGWLPPRRVGRPAGGLVARPDLAESAGSDSAADEDDPVAAALPYHILIQSAVDPGARLEIRIAERPTTGNLRSALVLHRVSRHGEAHWAGDSADSTIGGRDWIRTAYRYASKGSKTDSPRIATGIEYATINGRLLYTVTLHGDSDASAHRLESLLVPTLSVDANHPAAVPR